MRSWAEKAARVFAASYLLLLKRLYIIPWIDRMRE
jgi:hypothetical protein